MQCGTIYVPCCFPPVEAYARLLWMVPLIHRCCSKPLALGRFVDLCIDSYACGDHFATDKRLLKWMFAWNCLGRCCVRKIFGSLRHIRGICWAELLRCVTLLNISNERTVSWTIGYLWEVFKWRFASTVFRCDVEVGLWLDLWTCWWSAWRAFMILSYSFRLQHRLLRVVEPVGPDGNGENLILLKYHRASLNFF